LQAASIMPSPSAARPRACRRERDDDDPRLRHADGSARHLELLEVEPRLEIGAELLGHDRLEVGLCDLDLAVGELLEAGEGWFRASPCTRMPIFSSVSAKA
jgi:hypothetical protein